MTSPGPASPRSTDSHWGGRLWMSGMGLTLAAAGAFFFWFLWKNYAVAGRMDHWAETPCEIVASTVDGSAMDQHFQTKYEFQVTYRYEWEGRTLLGDRAKSKPVVAGIRKKLDSWESRFPTGRQTVCYVNPDDPAQAVLERDTKASIYSLWFPALFVVGGLGIVITSLFGIGRRHVTSSGAP